MTEVHTFDPEPEELSEEILRSGLHTLGSHPFTRRHAFLGLNLASKNIGNAERIRNFSNLMYVDLADNALVDVSFLGDLPALIQLNLRKNQLTNCLDFAPKRCDYDNAWSTGQTTIGSMLTLADFSENNITELHELDQHPFLECLLLSFNKIPRITGLSSLKYLQVLDLSYNSLTSIDGLDGLAITELNLEGNTITSLSGVSGLPRLSVLNISKNKVRSLAPLSTNLQLYNLDVRDNEIVFLRQTEFLGAMRWLQILSISGNPCCSKAHARARILFRLPTVVKLDLTPVSAEEKIRACNLYGSDLGDLRQRQSVFQKYFPVEEFENYSPYFEDDELDLSPDELCADFPLYVDDDGSSRNRTPAGESKNGEEEVVATGELQKQEEQSRRQTDDDLMIKNMAEHVLSDVMQHVHIVGGSSRNSARAADGLNRHTSQ